MQRITSLCPGGHARQPTLDNIFDLPQCEYASSSLNYTPFIDKRFFVLHQNGKDSVHIMWTFSALSQLPDTFYSLKITAHLRPRTPFSNDDLISLKKHIGMIHYKQSSFLNIISKISPQRKPRRPIGMSYEIRHFDTPLIRFSATEDSCSPEIQILWMNEQKKDLFPLDLQATNEGISKWLKRRTIPKNRAYVHNFLSKCGLSINRPMSIIKASKGLSLNDCYWVVEEGFTGTFSKFNLYENRFSQILALIAFTGHGNSIRTPLDSCPGAESMEQSNYSKAVPKVHLTPETNPTRSSMRTKLLKS